MLVKTLDGVMVCRLEFGPCSLVCFCEWESLDSGPGFSASRTHTWYLPSSPASKISSRIPSVTQLLSLLLQLKKFHRCNMNDPDWKPIPPAIVFEDDPVERETDEYSSDGGSREASSDEESVVIHGPRTVVICSRPNSSTQRVERHQLQPTEVSLWDTQRCGDGRANGLGRGV
jgi:hypothetical protein